MFDQEKFNAETNCDVCGRQGVLGVASSMMGAISFAYCGECIKNHAEPAYMLSFTHYSCDGNVAEWVRETSTYFRGAYVPYDEFIEYALAHKDEFPDPYEMYENDQG